MSTAYDVYGCWITDTVYPSFARMLATASEPEPSANAPCTKTTFLMPVFDADCAEADSRVPPASVAASTATTQRFFMASLQLAASMNHPEFDGPRRVGQLTFSLPFPHLVCPSRDVLCCYGRSPTLSRPARPTN